MKTTMARPVLFALLAGGMAMGAAAQELYRWVDQDRKVHYSDVPPPANVKYYEQKRPGDNVIEQDKIPYGIKLAMQNNPVTLYANDCGPACDNARALLGKRGIPFADRNPQKDAGAAAALTALAGQLDVPTIAIGSNKLSGFSEGAWNSALDSAGYPRTNANLRLPATPPKAAPVVAPAATDNAPPPAPGQ